MSSADEDDDFHICGRCKVAFYSIESYLDHKKSKSCQQSSKRPTHDAKEEPGVTPPTKKRGRPPSRFENLPEHIKQLAAPNSALSKEYACPKCECKVEDWAAFDRHMRKHHNLSQHWCKKCRTPFCDRYKLKRHVGRCRSELSLDASATGFVSFNSSSRRFYKSEDKSIQGDVEEALDAVPSTATDFSCRECSANCQTHQEILEHLKKCHPGIIPGVCKFCGQWFRQRQHLWRHVSSSLHDDLPDSLVEQVKSDIQHEKFFWPDLKLEKTRTHSQKPVKCPECLKVCSSRVYLEKHIQRKHHTPSPAEDDSGYRCLACHKVFVSTVSLKRHITMIHEETNTNGVQCEVCNKELKQNSQIVSHMEQFHTPALQGPLDDLKLLEDLTFSPLDVPHNCFVCCTVVKAPEDFLQHLQSHRVWAPHSHKACCPADLFDSELTPPVAVSVGRNERYLGAASHDGVKTDDSNSLHGIDHDALTDLIDEINEANQMLAGGCLDISDDLESDTTIERATSETNQRTDEHLLCAYCLQSFSSLKVLCDHKLNDHQLVLVFQCCQLTCGERFHTAEAYWAHHKSVHRQAAFICRTCNHHTESTGALLSHKMQKHKDVLKEELLCQLCNKKFDSRQELEIHVASTASHFMCSVCCRIFKKKAALACHETIHADSNSLLCEQCGGTFKSKLTLQRHRLTHNNERRFKCDTCGMSFNKMEYLKRHVSTKHSEEKPFACTFPECGKQFKRKDKLMDHLKTHSKEKKYTCEICGRKYRNRDGLRYHLKSHARGEGIECPVCAITVPQPCQLRQHMTEVHKVCIKASHVYHCVFCSSTYSRPETVKRHMEKEHSMKAVWHHRCPICQKGFAGPKGLEKHMATKHQHEKTSDTSKAEEFVAHTTDWLLEPDVSLPDNNTDLMVGAKASTSSDVKNTFINHERIIHVVTDKGDSTVVSSSKGKQHPIAFALQPSLPPPLPPSPPPPPPPPPALTNIHYEPIDIFHGPPLNLSTVETPMLTQLKPHPRPLQPKPDLLPPSIQVQSQSSVTINIGSAPLQAQSSTSSRFLILPSVTESQKKSFLQPITAQPTLQDPTYLSDPQVMRPPILTPVDPVLTSGLPVLDDMNRPETRLLIPLSVFSQASSTAMDSFPGRLLNFH